MLARGFFREEGSHPPLPAGPERDRTFWTPYPWILSDDYPRPACDSDGKGLRF